MFSLQIWEGSVLNVLLTNMGGISLECFPYIWEGSVLNVFLTKWEGSVLNVFVTNMEGVSLEYFPYKYGRGQS